MLDSGVSFKTGLYWFTNDLRCDDNPALVRAANNVDRLLCVYILDPSWFKPNAFGTSAMGEHRWRFLQQSLEDLGSELAKRGQALRVIHAPPLDVIPQLITVYDIDAIFRSQNAGFYENSYWRTLQQRYPMIAFETIPSHTLFPESSLPFPIAELPGTFSQFRKRVARLQIPEAVAPVQTLPLQPRGPAISAAALPPVNADHDQLFKGGACAGKKHLQQYFSTEHPGRYKRVRNALDGWENSTKFSPWLANGSLSARQVVSAVKDYEDRSGANESTSWIIFELLWREYFQWYAHAHGTKLFAYRGIKQKNPLTSFYPERLQRWRNGSTPYPLVNGCMKQLNATGYMSNRGRQIVASCFVNELALDWRYGAAYFENRLVDYDVASNWGNWQYLAGVGADPRGKRHFDLEKQTAMFDPAGTFIDKWQGHSLAGPMDSVDAADWPLT